MAQPSRGATNKEFSRIQSAMQSSRADEQRVDLVLEVRPGVPSSTRKTTCAVLGGRTMGPWVAAAHVHTTIWPVSWFRGCCRSAVAVASGSESEGRRGRARNSLRRRARVYSLQGAGPAVRQSPKRKGCCAHEYLLLCVWLHPERLVGIEEDRHSDVRSVTAACQTVCGAATERQRPSLCILSVCKRLHPCHL